MTETKPSLSTPPPSRGRRLLRLLVALVALVGVLLAIFVRPDESVESLRATYGQKPSKYIAIDGMEVHYRDEGRSEGDAPPLLLLHGTSSSLHTWDGWTARMHEHRRVIRLDLPAFGLTGPRPDRDYSAATYVAFLARFLDALHVERVDLAGNSFGGRLAWLFTASHPERVRKLVLIDAAGMPGVPLPPIFALARTPFGGILRWCTPDFMVRRNLEQVYGDPALVENALVERHARLLRRVGNRQALIDRLHVVDPPGLVERLRDIHVPTLILWGGSDVWIPVAHAAEFHEAIAGSKLLIYQSGGHVPMEELAEETARDATMFLDTR